jgi:hypothetical protein
MNRRNPCWGRRFQGVVVGVENRHQVPEQAIVTDYDLMVGYHGGTGVDEDTFAKHKRAVRRGANLDWDRLAA